MPEQIVANVTSGLSSFAGMEGAGWLITIVIFFGIIFTLFLVSRNVRRTIVGGIISFVLLIIYLISRWAGVEAQNGNGEPGKWICYVALFFIVSIAIGWIFEKTKYGKKLNKWIDEESMEKKK